MNTAKTQNNQFARKRTILLVDDDLDLLDIGKKLLTKIDYNVHTAMDYEEAIHITNQHAADIFCAIIDLTMPDIDGIEICKRVRTINPDIRIILSSGYLEAQIRDRISGTLLDGFLQKPFQLNELHSKLQKLHNLPV